MKLLDIQTYITRNKRQRYDMKKNQDKHLRAEGEDVELRPASFVLIKDVLNDGRVLLSPARKFEDASAIFLRLHRQRVRTPVLVGNGEDADHVVSVLAQGFVDFLSEDGLTDQRHF